MNDEPTALLLDLDGTLVDTAADLMAALNSALVEHGRAAIDLQVVKTLIGDGMPRLVGKGFESTGGLPGADELEAAVSHCLGYYQSNLTVASSLYPGVSETLATLKASGHRLAVCTNKPEQAAHEILSALGVHSFMDAIVGGDTLDVKKPDPGHLRQTLERLEVSANNAVMVGDSRNDVLAARAAKLPVIFVTYGYNTVPVSVLGPDAFIDSFEHLPQALADLSAR